MRNQFTEQLYIYKDSGLLDGYSDNHFLIRAMRGEIDIIKEYSQLIDYSAIRQGVDFSSSFLMNLTTGLRVMHNFFRKKEIERFITDQLSAGKSNYDEAQFFRALSELHVLRYLGMYAGVLKEAKYEPRLIGNTNPEARFVFDDDVILDIEVKTPGFISTNSGTEAANGLLKPNVVLNQSVKGIINDFCRDNGLKFVSPRVLKLKEYIMSAAAKFEVPTTNKHFNILFINWTFTDFPECGLCEPLSLLVNTSSGLIGNKEAMKLIGINDEQMNKISAVVVYRDTLNTLLSNDFRYHFQYKTFRYIINYVNTNSDYNFLSSALGMNPCNFGLAVEWFPFDYVFNKEAPTDLLQKACNIVGNSIINMKLRS